MTISFIPKSVIVSTVKDGKESSWENLDKIWSLFTRKANTVSISGMRLKACLEGNALTLSWLSIGSALWLGILTSISPCPLHHEYRG